MVLAEITEYRLLVNEIIYFLIFDKFRNTSASPGVQRMSEEI